MLGLTLAGGDEVSPFLEWARKHLGEQTEEFRGRFAPAFAGLVAIAEGGEFDADGTDLSTGGRRFLGWTNERHWLLPDMRQQEVAPGA
jgi:hypothetical protein